MLLIIQNGLITPFMCRYLDEKCEVIKSFETDVSKINLDIYDVIIILGGRQSVRMINEYEYLKQVALMIENCIRIEKPLIGICLGCQLIAYVLGCEIKSCEKLNIGYDAKILGKENIFRCHLDYIEKNDSIQVIEYFEKMPYLFTHGKKVVGIQCHPDIAPEAIGEYANCNSCAKYVMYAMENKELINKNNGEILRQILQMVL